MPAITTSRTGRVSTQRRRNRRHHLGFTCPLTSSDLPEPPAGLRVRFQSGDESTIGELYERYGPPPARLDAPRRHGAELTDTFAGSAKEPAPGDNQPMTTFAEWTARAVDVETGGLTVAAHVDGDGPVVTFVHGYPSSSFDIVPVIERVASARWVTLDLPGFGASDKPIGHPHTMAAAADAVEAVWRHAGVSSTLLVAHDYGATVGQELVARSTSVEITAVVWMNGGVYPDLHRPTLGQQMLLDPEHGAEVSAAMDEAALANGIGITWGTRVPLTDDVVHEMWESIRCNGGNLQMHAMLHYIAERKRFAERWVGAMERCPVPVTFVWGDLDPVSGAHMADRLAERMPHADLRRLSDVGHWPTLEAPDEVAAAISGLLAD